MAKRWKLIRSIFVRNGYDTYESLADVELLSITSDAVLYFSDGGVTYRADLDTTSPIIVS